MTNGQEKARENLVAFQRWAATKIDDDLKQIVFRGQLNRGEVANAIGIGKSAVRQNPAKNCWSLNTSGESPLAPRGQSPQLKSRLRPFF